MPEYAMVAIGLGIRVETQPDGQPQVLLVNPSADFRPKVIPTEYTFAFVAGVRNLQEGPDAARRLSWRVVDPDGAIVTTSKHWNMPATPIAPRPSSAVYVAAQLQGVVLRVAGSYRIEVYDDETLLGSQTFTVHEPQEG